jgi:hypothetical protein
VLLTCAAISRGQRQAVDDNQRSAKQQEPFRACLGKKSAREEGQALRQRQQATVRATDGCSSPDAAAAAAFSSAAARQSPPQRQAKAAQADDLAVVYLQTKVSQALLQQRA